MQRNTRFFDAPNKVTASKRHVLTFAFSLLASCGGGSGDTPTPTPTSAPTSAPGNATVSVSISGLRAGQKIALSNNASDQLTITANGSFSFANSVAVGQSYAVTIATPPTGETCVLNGATGTVQTAAAISVAVSCGPTLLHSFSGSDGASDENVFTRSPNIILAADGNIYGTTVRGGSGDFGTVFKITPAGIFSVLHNFNDSTDGKNPEAPLVEGPGGELYGTTNGGGFYGVGTLFKITRNGSFTLLENFGGENRILRPKSALIQEGGDLYGTSNSGGIIGVGTVFKFNISSGNLTVLHSFTGGADGAYPSAPLVRTSDGNFYGSASQGGPNGGGSVFRITPAGALTVLHNFGGTDGAYLYGPLVRDADDNVFGTVYGGSDGTKSLLGNIFKISASGEFSILHRFNGTDGAGPAGGLILGADGNLYGTTSAGGEGGVATGTIFRITLAGDFAVLHTFGSGAAGRVPRAGLVQDQSGVIYGTTGGGGAHNLGTVFKF